MRHSTASGTTSGSGPEGPEGPEPARGHEGETHSARGRTSPFARRLHTPVLMKSLHSGPSGAQRWGVMDVRSLRARQFRATLSQENKRPVLGCGPNAASIIACCCCKALATLVAPAAAATAAVNDAAAGGAPGGGPGGGGGGALAAAGFASAAGSLALVASGAPCASLWPVIAS